MDNQKHGQVAKLSLATKKALIKNTSSFSLLEDETITELAKAAEEIHVKEGAIVVKEGDLVDAVFLIAAGSAVVTKLVIDEGRDRATLLAVLNQGAGIGLKDVGLYSADMRTATVIANSFCILLKIPLDKLQVILKQNPEMSDIMQEDLSAVLKLRLIKESVPISYLSNERLAEIAQSVKEVSFAADEIIFTEGEFADNCFIIYKGQVDITQSTPTGEQNNILSLDAGKLFGEDSFLTYGLWNVTARASTACKLLVLERSYLIELTHVNKDGMGDDVVMLLLTNKNHLVRTPDIIYQPRTLSNGELVVTLKNPTDYSYIQLNEFEWFVWLQSNGDLTPLEIAHRAQKKYPDIEVNDALRMLQNLLDQGFVFFDTKIKHTVAKKTSLANQEGLFNWLKWVYFLKKPDKIANLLFAYGGSYLISVPAGICYLLLILAGFVFFFITTPLAINQIPTSPRLIVTILMAISMSMVFNLIAPLLKLLAIKRFGHLVPHIGLVWYAIGPSLYVDTSDLLMSSKKPRIRVALVSLMANFLTASLVSIYAYYISSANSLVFYWLCALFLYLYALRSLDPLQNLEGYKFLAEKLDLPKLRQEAFELLDGSSSRITFMQKKMVFWLQALLYLVLNLGLTLWLCNYFVKLWPYLSTFRTPALILIVVSFGLEIFFEWLAMKKQLGNGVRV